MWDFQSDIDDVMADNIFISEIPRDLPLAPLRLVPCDLPLATCDLKQFRARHGQAYYMSSDSFNCPPNPSRTILINVESLISLALFSIRDI